MMGSYYTWGGIKCFIGLLYGGDFITLEGELIPVTKESTRFTNATILRIKSREDTGYPYWNFELYLPPREKRKLYIRSMEFTAPYLIL